MTQAETYGVIGKHIFTAHRKYEGNRWIIILANNFEDARKKAEAFFGSTSVQVNLVASTGDPQVYEI